MPAGTQELGEPRPFSPHEKDRIRQSLLDRGREVFGSHGIKGTTIRQLCRAVGISPGAFYSFFPSKEHLLLEILEEEERDIRGEFVHCLGSREVTASTFASCLKGALTKAMANPLIRRLLDEEEFQVLVHRLPPDRLEAHIQGDIAFAQPLISELQEQGIMADHCPQVITGMLRGLLLLTLHSKDIGEDVYEDVMDLFVDFVSRGLLRKDSDDDQR